MHECVLILKVWTLIHLLVGSDDFLDLFNIKLISEVVVVVGVTSFVVVDWEIGILFELTVVQVVWVWKSLPIIMLVVVGVNFDNVYSGWS